MQFLNNYLQNQAKCPIFLEEVQFKIKKQFNKIFKMKFLLSIIHNIII